MTQDQIDAFLSVTQHGNFSRAADNLFVTQSTLSHRISELEKELGVTLFTRGRGIRSAQLTSQGEAFVPIAEEWRRLWLATLSLGQVKSRDNLRITVSHTLYNSLLIDIIQKLLARNLPAYMHFSSTGSRDAFRRIEHGEADFAIVGNTFESRDASIEFVARERLVFISSIDSPYGETVRAIDLASDNEVFINWGSSQRFWHEYWFGSDFRPAIRIEAMQLVAPIFQSGGPNYWALVSQSAANELISSGGFKVSNLDHPLPPRDICLVSSRPIKTPYHDYILEDLRSAAASRGGFILLD